MSRQSLLNTLSKQEQSLVKVWEWYELQRALIGEEKGRVWDALARGAGVAPRYFGRTREELDAEFTFQTAELNFLSMLGMLACTEAALRIDFIERVSYREKGRCVSPVSRSVQAARERGPS